MSTRIEVDREALDQVLTLVESWVGDAWDDGNASGLDGWVGPNRGAGDVDEEAVRARGRAVDKSLDAVAGPLRALAARQPAPSAEAREALVLPGVDSPARDDLSARMRRALDEDMQYDDDDWTRLADAALAWFAARQPAPALVCTQDHAHDMSDQTRCFAEVAGRQPAPVDGDSDEQQARIDDYRSGRWCGECRHGVAEDPPCCTPCPCCGGHSGEHAPRITVTAAPTMEQVAEVLAAHGRTVTRRRAVDGGRVVAEEECGECGHALPWNPSKRARAVADHQAERVAALWGGGERG